MRGPPRWDAAVAAAHGAADAQDLLTYRLQPGVAGTHLVPDLATQVPSPSANGLTYEFHLKHGIRFGPPVIREITSYDIAYAFERMNAKPLASGNRPGGTGQRRPGRRSRAAGSRLAHRLTPLDQDLVQAVPFQRSIRVLLVIVPPFGGSW